MNSSGQWRREKNARGSRRERESAEFAEDGQPDRQKGRQTERQAGRQAGRLTDRQTDRQTDRLGDKSGGGLFNDTRRDKA